MNLRSVLITVAALSCAAVLFAQTSQSSSSQSTSRNGGSQASSSSSSRASSSSSGSKSSNAFATGSRNAGGSARAGGSGSGFSIGGKPTHAILYTLDSSVASNNDAKQKAFADHMKYLGEQQGKGKVVLFGPWRDLPGSMAIVIATSDEEANEIARNDPAVRSGSLTFEVRAWLVQMPAGSTTVQK